MGYRHISNLYQNKEILLFKQCYAMEKIHGTSSHIKFKDDKLTFFSGGAKYSQFVALFNQEELLAKFRENAVNHPGAESITVYGEAYGGNVQKMAHTYGPNLKFVAFEVCIGDNDWFEVPRAESLANKLGFEFVSYKVIDTTEEAINAEMMADSVQAVRNGMGAGKMREGIVLRPLLELQHMNSGRIICKHKRPEFAERMNTPSFSNEEELKILEDAKAIAEEWVTSMRLDHVLDKLPGAELKDANKVIAAMVEDVMREGKGEIVDSKPARKAINKKTMQLFMAKLKG